MATVAEAGELEREFRQLLAALEMVASGPTPAYSPVGTKSGFQSSMPTTGGGELGTIGWLRERWERASDDDARRALIDEAKGKLDELRRGNRGDKKRAAFDNEDLLKRAVLEEGEGFSPYEVARRFPNVTPSLCRRWRDAGGRDMTTGLRVRWTAATDEAKAVEMIRSGLSTRDVAKRLSTDARTVHQNQVMRWVRSAAREDKAA